MTSTEFPRARSASVTSVFHFGIKSARCLFGEAQKVFLCSLCSLVARVYFFTKVDASAKYWFQKIPCLTDENLPILIIFFQFESPIWSSITSARCAVVIPRHDRDTRFKRLQRVSKISHQQFPLLQYTLSQICTSIPLCDHGHAIAQWL